MAGHYDRGYPPPPSQPSGGRYPPPVGYGAPPIPSHHGSYGGHPPPPHSCYGHDPPWAQDFGQGQVNNQGMPRPTSAPHFGHPPPHHGVHGVPPPPPACGHPSPYGYPAPPHYPHYPPPPGYGHHPYGNDPYRNDPYGNDPYGYRHPYDHGRQRSRSPRRDIPSGATKYTCRYFIGIENEGEFRVVKRIIGRGGGNMKDIVAKAGGEGKLRILGKGSGFICPETNEESPEPLQMCISCPSAQSYDIACRSFEDLLNVIYADYDTWCIERKKPERAPEIKMTERLYFGEQNKPERAPESKMAEGGSGGSGNGAVRRRGKRGGRKNRGRGGNAQPASSLGAAGDEGSDSEGSDDDDDGEHGVRPPHAPFTEEIEKCIEERNEARKRNDFREADRIRDDMKKRGVMFCDEKGGYGSGTAVTKWRYWKD